jgi:hypothetical protein
VQYLLLIYNDEREWLALPEDERRAVTGRYFALVDELRREGKYVGGAPLRPTTEARTVTRETGTTLVTDGPFAETKEQLGGYFLVEAESADEAVAIAAKIPATEYGRVEVRPVVDVGGPPA